MRLIWTLAIGVVSLLTGMALESACWGAPAGPQSGISTVAHKKGKGKGHKKPGVMEELNAAHNLLTEADHDYDGHRIKAAEEVHKAIDDIEGKVHGKKEHKEKEAVAKAEVKKHETHEGDATQKISDDQMHKALDKLEHIHDEMKTKHPKAAENVTKAIAEIKTALKIN